MEKQKVLVLGGSGYLGGLLVDKLIRLQFHPVVFDCLLYETRYIKRADFIYGDIRDTESVLKAAEGCFAVVNMAGIVGDLAASVNPVLTRDVNYLAVENIAKRLPKEVKLIHISTCSVYGQSDEILDENSLTKPLSVYAATKLASEPVVLNRGGTIFRLGTVFGLGDEFSRLRADLVVQTMTFRAIKSQCLMVNGGEQWRPIISTRCVVNYIYEALIKDRPGLFIVAKENTTIKDLAERVAKVIPGTKIVYTELNFQDARNYRVNTAKADATFNYRPNITVEEEVLRIAYLVKSGRLKNPEDPNYSNGTYLGQLYSSGLYK